MTTDLIKPLHGLRGAAALTVVIGHYEIVSGSASLGVVLFFVLSGFLMARLYLDTDFNAGGVWRYISARFARVYPLFAIVVIVAGIAGHVEPRLNVFDMSLLQIARNLMLLGNNLTIWTISTEFQFYIFFIAFWWFRSRLSSAALAIYPFAALTLAASLAFDTLIGRTELPGYIHIFALGFVVADLARRNMPVRTSRVLVAVFAVLYAIVFLYSQNYYENDLIYRNPVALVVCTGLVLTTLVAGDCLVNRIFSSPPLLWAGEVSFGIYLLHRPAAALVEFAAPGLERWASLSLSIVLTLLAAQLAYVLIEKPSRTRLRALSNRIGPGARPGKDAPPAVPI